MHLILILILLGNLTLIKGSAALQYSGDATGGIIIVEAPRSSCKGHSIMEKPQFLGFQTVEEFQLIQE